MVVLWHVMSKFSLSVIKLARTNRARCGDRDHCHARSGNKASRGFPTHTGIMNSFDLDKHLVSMCPIACN